MNNQNLKKILLILGTRPEAIKMAPLFKELKKSKVLDPRILVTAQHRQMLDSVLEIFDIRPDFDLNLMKAGQDLTDITSKVLLGCRDVFLKWRPDLALVHGDTTTSMAGSLAAFYQRVPVGHVEAGLRTFDIYSPYPEELNRQVTSKIAKYHFCPTQLSLENLMREGIDPQDALVTGNTVIDALFDGLTILEGSDPSKIQTGYVKSDRPFILITGHRRENFGENFLNICQAIRELAEKYQHFDFVYPVHLNPNVQDPVQKILTHTPNVKLLPPLDYLPFISLMKDSYLILTDSGGIQEEAPSLGKPVLVMRSTTERPEAVSAGTVKLVGSSKWNIINEVSLLIESSQTRESMLKATNPYGDGQAAGRIRAFLETRLCGQTDAPPR